MRLIRVQGADGMHGGGIQWESAESMFYWAIIRLVFGEGVKQTGPVRSSADGSGICLHLLSGHRAPHDRSERPWGARQGEAGRCEWGVDGGGESSSDGLTTRKFKYNQELCTQSSTLQPLPHLLNGDYSPPPKDQAKAGYRIHKLLHGW